MFPLLETARPHLKPLELATRCKSNLFPRWEIANSSTTSPWPYPPDGAELCREARASAMEAAKLGIGLSA